MQYPFDSYGLAELPPPEEKWPKACAFIAGIIANRLTYWLAEFGCLQPNPALPCKGRTGYVARRERIMGEINNLLKIFDNYMESGGIQSCRRVGRNDKCAKQAYKNLLNEFLEYQNNIWVGDSEYAAESWNEFVQFCYSQDGCNNYILSIINNAEYWLAEEFFPKSIPMESELYLPNACFWIGFKFDSYVWPYTFVEDAVPSDYHLTINSGNHFDSIGSRAIFGRFPSFVNDRNNFDSYISEILQDECEKFNSFTIGSEMPTPDSLGVMMCSAWTKLCKIDSPSEAPCEITIEEKGKIFVITVGNVYSEEVRQRNVMLQVIKHFMDNEIYDASRALTSLQIAKALGEEITTRSKVDPVDGMKKCKAEWAKYFSFESKSGNPTKNSGPGYWMKLHPPGPTEYAAVRRCQVDVGASSSVSQ